MLPRQRTEGLVVSSVDSDLVIFDEQTSHLHTNPAPIAAVWHACDGTVDSTVIAQTTGLTIEHAAAAIRQLRDAGLLEADLAPAVQSSRNRRGLVKQAVLGAASVSVTAPMAAQAQSADQIVCASHPTLHSHLVHWVSP